MYKITYHYIIYPVFTIIRYNIIILNDITLCKYIITIVITETRRKLEYYINSKFQTNIILYTGEQDIIKYVLRKK